MSHCKSFILIDSMEIVLRFLNICFFSWRSKVFCWTIRDHTIVYVVVINEVILYRKINHCQTSRSSEEIVYHMTIYFWNRQQMCFLNSTMNRFVSQIVRKKCFTIIVQKVTKKHCIKGLKNMKYHNSICTGSQT